jgi:hypothetical protein
LSNCFTINDFHAAKLTIKVQTLYDSFSTMFRIFVKNLYE